jgi:hypothetical protein
LTRNLAEVVVGGKHRQAVSETKLREERIDRPGLDARAPAVIAQSGGFDVIRSIRNDERNRGEAIQDLRPGIRAQEALQKLLEDEAVDEDQLTGHKRRDEANLLRTHSWRGHRRGADAL